MLFALASNTLIASGPLFGAPFGLGIERLPFSLPCLGLSIPLGLPLMRRGVFGLVETNYQLSALNFERDVGLRTLLAALKSAIKALWLTSS